MSLAFSFCSLSPFGIVTLTSRTYLIRLRIKQERHSSDAFYARTRGPADHEGGASPATTPTPHCNRLHLTHRQQRTRILFFSLPLLLGLPLTLVGLSIEGRLVLMLRRTAFCLAANVVPPSVLVLTMTLNGGALTSALRELGYHPYTFDTTFRYGHVVNHPREWLAVLQHYKQFDPIILTRPDADPNAPNKSGSTTPCAQDGTSADARSSLAWSQFDALVGPPATLAFESILRACPLSTRVVLVEEPDKAAWESHMNLILQQVRLETRHVRFLGSARQLSEMVDMMTDIRRALGQRRERSARQTKVLSGRPLHNLSQGAALSAFEDHVKEVVPRDRLLVYRLGDGWKPLCDFLGKPVPLDSHVSTAGTSSSAPASSTDAIDAAAQVLPFPANTDGLEVVSTLSVATSRSQLALLVFLLSMAAFAFVFLTPVVWRLKALYAEEEVQYRAAVQPYVDQGKQTGDVSLRRVLVLTKKASLEHQRQYEEEGSFWQQWCAAWKQATHKGETGPEK